MNKLLTTSFLALALSHAAYAQEATTEEPATETPAETTEAPAASDADQPGIAGQLDTGEPVAEAGAAAAPGQPDGTYIKEVVGDWQIQCLTNENGDDPCQMYQLLKDAQGNNVAEVSIFKVAGSGQVKAGATFIVPLETLLTQKLTMAVDGGQAKRFDYSFCNPVGCYARVGFLQEDINRFKRGNAAKITIVPALAPDQKVQVDMSLTGFTAGYEQASEIRN